MTKDDRVTSGKLPEKNVVTSFLQSGDEVLILRRSERVGSYQGRWAGVSGYMEHTDDEQALIEIEEETSLHREELELLKKGKPLRVDDRQMGVTWVIHPYLFRIKDRSKVKIDWEHKETRWIKPKELVDYQTVPCLKEALDRVLFQDEEKHL